MKRYIPFAKLIPESLWRTHYSREHRAKCAKRALDEVSIQVQAHPSVTTFEVKYIVYMPGDVYSFTEFDFDFEFADVEESDVLASDGTLERIKESLLESLSRQMPALQDPVINVWLR